METEASTWSSAEGAAQAAPSPEHDVTSTETASAAAAEPGSSTADVSRLQADIEKLRTQADDSQRKYLMALADLDNFRKQNEKRTIDRLALGKRTTIGKFLPVFDNLQRALAFDEDSAGLRGGLAATMRGFESLLASENVTAITVVGSPFNPHNAEAIATRDSSDHDDEIVLEEVERGYQLGDELLRPAKVIVARRIPAP